MKRWMTSLAPNRRTKFVSFTSRLLGKWPPGPRTPLGRTSEASVASAPDASESIFPEACVASRMPTLTGDGPKCQLLA